MKKNLLKRNLFISFLVVMLVLVVLINYPIFFIKDNINENYKNYVCSTFSEQKSDFIAQECLIQHPDIAKLNPTSLNCCRVTTIYISGKFGHATNLKIGKKGSKVDNWHSSYFCGVDTNGKVMKRGYTKDLQVVTSTDMGTPFDSIIIPNYKQMIQTLEHFHKKYFVPLN